MKKNSLFIFILTILLSLSCAFQALADDNTELNWYYVPAKNNAIPEGAKEGVSFLKDYDGFFAVDEGAAYVMSECERLGMKVPDDIQIVSYDGTFITDLTEPRLTSIVQPVEQIAADAADLIVQRIQGMSFLNKKIVRPVTLKAGGSTISCSTEE